ncbi:NADH dehydrogenase [ubiquinone] 1 alpha subcomplex assembly factor 2 B17.2-like [Triplophysa tibetana]|uniref:NADH dehydrogenase [ubiquinone] 1 alpha subcomplex assembly factor 2 B17.2-like n=1 Tax=Triplophysa tibetana TaxID=1572043 RepID=A0A5A9NXB1_9TELE|nr:NADH dehydrogenase [ubiquinone] 1 alpha subcomplex assembly factor 2 B17.2-like [Triplophysa tibetana]
MSRFTSILRRTFGVVKEHVGTDNFGNKYYNVPEQKTWTGRVTRHRRLMEAANPAEFEYSCSIPSEWDAWIRGRRKHPPTIEELLKNELYRENIKIKAEEVEERDKALQSKEYKEGLVASPVQAQIKGHASATLFGQSEVSEEPVSTANTFQPGSWASPGTKK